MRGRRSSSTSSEVGAQRDRLCGVPVVLPAVIVSVSAPDGRVTSASLGSAVRDWRRPPPSPPRPRSTACCPAPPCDRALAAALVRPPAPIVDSLAHRQRVTVGPPASASSSVGPSDHRNVVHGSRSRQSCAGLIGVRRPLPFRRRRCPSLRPCGRRLRRLRWSALAVAAEREGQRSLDTVTSPLSLTERRHRDVSAPVGFDSSLIL